MVYGTLAGRFCENIVVKFQHDFGGAANAEAGSRHKQAAIAYAI